jgi:hypothetical protein
MDEVTFSKVLIGLVSAITTFILGVLYNTHLRKKQHKQSFRPFLKINQMGMRGDFHDIHKGDNAKHIITNYYREIRDFYNKSNSPVFKVSYLSFKNLGPGLVLECNVKAKFFVKDQDFKWEVNTTIDIIEKDELLYICIDNVNAPIGTFFLDKAEFIYKTQADEKIKVLIKYSNDLYSFDYLIQKFRWFYRRWTNISIPVGLEWEVPNK